MLTLLDAMHRSQLLACKAQLGRAAPCPHGTACCKDGIASCCSPVLMAAWRTLVHRPCKPLMWLASLPPAPPYKCLTFSYQIMLLPRCLMLKRAAAFQNADCYFFLLFYLKAIALAAAKSILTITNTDDTKGIRGSASY